MNDNQQAAIDKLDKEMEKAKDRCSKYMAEQLIGIVTENPQLADLILDEKKTLSGALAKVKELARKNISDGVGCVDEEQTMEVARAYYGISAAAPNVQAIGKKAAPAAAPAVNVNLDDFF